MAVPLAGIAQPVLDALTASIAVLDEEGTIVALNRAWQETARVLAGREVASPLGASYLEVCDRASGTDAAFAAEAARGIRAVIAGTLPEFSLEYPCHEPGRRRWFLLRVTRFTHGGRIFAVAAHENVTNRKEADEQVKFLLGELRHRAKNLIAVIQSIARQMARDEPAREFARELGQRLQSLAASQDAIFRGDRQQVLIEDLIRSQLSHLGLAGGGRLTWEGGRIGLRPAAAQAVGFALHELATNAMKYGALSNDRGKVRIAWGLSPGEGGRRFRMSWTEHDGPEVRKPQRSGFGQIVIERMAEEALGGEVELTYAPAGLCWVLEADESAIVVPAEDAGGRG